MKNLSWVNRILSCLCSSGQELCLNSLDGLKSGIAFALGFSHRGAASQSELFSAPWQRTITVSIMIYHLQSLSSWTSSWAFLSSVFFLLANSGMSAMNLEMPWWLSLSLSGSCLLFLVCLDLSWPWLKQNGCDYGLMIGLSLMAMILVGLNILDFQ